MTRALRILCCLLCLLACPLASWAIRKGDVKNLAVSPSQINLQVGQEQAFHLMNTEGYEETSVEWSVSAPDAFDGQASSGVVHALKPGQYILTGRSPNGEAAATIKVNPPTNPPGAPIWSAAEFAGCTVTLARSPAEGQVAAYGQEQCPDGPYVSAYAADGTMLSRHKVVPGEAMPEGKPFQPAAPLSLRSASICDAVQAGDTRARIATLLKQRNLRYSTEGGDLWIVQEPKVECRMWFESGAVVKKRKVLVTE